MPLPKCRLINSDVLEGLQTLPDESVQCCVTSPPYWGLRDYGVPGQLGLEKTPEEYLEKMVAVFREVRRVLRKDGTMWLNVGDSYTHSQPGRNRNGTGGQIVRPYGETERVQKGDKTMGSGLKPKDLCMIPARLALALQADGWWLRSEITWCKKAPMPESTTDRPANATEKIFLLTKSAKYFYDNMAYREESTGQNGAAANFQRETKDHLIPNQFVKQHRIDRKPTQDNGTRNLWNYWVIGPANYAEAHFATFPPAIPERCIKLGSKEGDLILDPFSGAATTLMVAAKLGRDAIGIELNPGYVLMGVKRLKRELGMLVEIDAR